MSDLCKLTSEDINKNSVNTINQFRVLAYLKSNLNIYSFEVYLYDKDTIKVVDSTGAIGYFKYDDEKKEVLFLEEL